MPPRNTPHRTESDLTHVSDSEPEREASRRRNHAESFSSESESFAATPPATGRPALSSISNAVLGSSPACSLGKRLDAIEANIAEIKSELNAQRQST
jgi:hypothetical protein